MKTRLTELEAKVKAEMKAELRKYRPLKAVKRDVVFNSYSNVTLKNANGELTAYVRVDYTCGCCWNESEQLEEAAQTLKEVL